jgi:hypothetical protein
MTFTFTDDSSVSGGAGAPPYGTVVVSTISGSTTKVDVLVTLASGNKFVDTGFQVTLASGLTPSMFNTANASGYTFSADIISGQTGNTGSVASLGGVTGSSVPEPATLCLLGSGLGMLSVRRKKARAATCQRAAPWAT